MKRLKKLGMTVCIVLGVMLGMTTSKAESAEKIFKLGLSSPPGNPEAVASVKFSEYVKEFSGGKMRVDVLSGGQGGGEREIGEAMTVGTMHFAVLAGILMNFDQALMIVEWDLLFKNNDHVRAAMNGEIGEKISKRLIDNTGIRKLAVFMRTPRLLTTNKPVNTLDDLKGMKIRVPEMPARVAIWKALGARPTPMSFTEVIPSLQLGTIDGQENPIGIISSAKIYEAIKYLANTRHLYGFMLLLVAEPVWQNFSEEEREIILKAAAKAAEFNDKLVTDSESELMKEVSAHMKITEPDMEPWRKASKDIYKDYSNVKGFTELYEAIVKLGEKY
jgi:tripartite ATP-independent transporter DctP family solute receptor